MTKLRFEFMFDDVDPKLLRKGKDLKKKNKYGLKQVEGHIKWIQQNWSQSTAITVLCHDKEEGTTYAFDNISIVPFSSGGKEVALFSEIESQILQAPDNVISDPNSLIMDIESQYQNELEEEEIPKKEKSKKGFKLPSIQVPFQKKKELSKTGSSDQYNTEYVSEITQDNQYETETEEPSEEPEVIDGESEGNTEEINTNEEESFDFEDEPEYKETTSSLEESSLYPTAQSIDNSSNNVYQENQYQVATQPIMNVRPLKKHETVNLLTLQEYCDVGEEIKLSIDQLTEKLKQENLFKFVGIPSAGLTNTRIDEYRSNYALLKLSEAKFENLRELYSREVNGLVAEALEKLKTAIVLVWNTPYDLKVKNDKKDILDEMENKASKQIKEFMSQQEELLKDKQAKFEADQEIELQQFIAQQKATKNAFIAQEKERSQNLIDSKAEAINVRLEKEREEFLDEEMYKLKNDMNLNLFDGKRKTIQELAVGVGKANEDVWNQALKEIEEIQNEIREKTPLWASEIKEFNILEEQEHQRSKAIEDLNLRKESLEIKRLETEINLKRQEELEHENKMLAIKLETALSKNELYEVEQKQHLKANELYDVKPSPLSILTGNRHVAGSRK